jgi:hypothetical protein
LERFGAIRRRFGLGHGSSPLALTGFSNWYRPALQALFIGSLWDSLY